MVGASVRDLSHRCGDTPVVDRVVDQVRDTSRRVGQLEPHVHEKALPLLAFLAEDTVVAEELQPGELDRHAGHATLPLSIACAAASAST